MEQVTFESLLKKSQERIPVLRKVFAIHPPIKLVDISTGTAVNVWRIQPRFVCITNQKGLCPMANFRFPTPEDYLKKEPSE